MSTTITLTPSFLNSDGEIPQQFGITHMNLSEGEVDKAAAKVASMRFRNKKATAGARIAAPYVMSREIGEKNSSIIMPQGITSDMAGHMRAQVTLIDKKTRQLDRMRAERLRRGREKEMGMD